MKQLRLPPVLTPLMAKNHWLVWRRQDDRKVPYQAERPRLYASSTNQSTWSPYAKAVAALPKVDGVGFCILGSGIGALDLDECYNDDTRYIAKWARQIINDSDGAYCEITPSLCGLRILGYATGRRVHRKLQRDNGGRLEIFRDAEQYITVSGDELEPGRCRKLTNIDALIDALAGEQELIYPKAHGWVDRDVSSLSPKAICDKHSIVGWLRQELLHGHQIGTERRHRMHYKLAASLQELHIPPAEAFVLLRDCGFNKHDKDKPIWDLIDKLWA
jgi:hypothetical protein